ncbi:MAG: inositol monophosphatase family protein [Mycobacterium sp.]
MSQNFAEELRAVAEQVAAEAADFVRGRRVDLFGSGSTDPRDDGVTIRAKSGPTDAVTIADTETEQLVRDRLAVLRPGESILGEECGGSEAAAGTVRWVVDPIDGTVNFVYGIPAYAVSVAAQVDGISVAGAVADVCSGEVFSAAAGGGAHVQSGVQRRVLRCSAVTDLSMTLLGTGFGYDAHRRAAQAALVAQVIPVVRDIRRIGSAALDLCAVAAGRLDAHYEHGLNVWDWAAGALIAAEAGAVVVLPDPAAGGAAPLLVAAAPGVAPQLLAALERFSGLGPLP